MYHKNWLVRRLIICARIAVFLKAVRLSAWFYLKRKTSHHIEDFTIPPSSPPYQKAPLLKPPGGTLTFPPGTGASATLPAGPMAGVWASSGPESSGSSGCSSLSAGACSGSSGCSSTSAGVRSGSVATSSGTSGAGAGAGSRVGAGSSS